jgi:hypothetical protein
MINNYDPDELIQGLMLILTKNRSSLSVTDVVILERSIIALEGLTTVPDSSERKAQFGIIVGNLLKVFSAFRVIKIMKEFFDDYQDMN